MISSYSSVRTLHDVQRKRWMCAYCVWALFMGTRARISRRSSRCLASGNVIPDAYGAPPGCCPGLDPNAGKRRPETGRSSTSPMTRRSPCMNWPTRLVKPLKLLKRSKRHWRIRSTVSRMFLEPEQNQIRDSKSA